MAFDDRSIPFIPLPPIEIVEPRRDGVDILLCVVVGAIGLLDLAGLCAIAAVLLTW